MLLSVHTVGIGSTVKQMCLGSVLQCRCGVTLAEPNAGVYFVPRSRAQSTRERLNLLVTPGLRVREQRSSVDQLLPWETPRPKGRNTRTEPAGNMCIGTRQVSSNGDRGGGLCLLINQSTEASNKAIIIICVQVNETHLCDRFVVLLCFTASVHRAISYTV